jgi:flavin-binding protein dodecin
MAEHVYKVIEVIGSSSESFEKAAKAAVETAAAHVKDLRIAEVVSLDMQVSEGKVATYRAKVKLSFKYHPEMHHIGA